MMLTYIYITRTWEWWQRWCRRGRSLWPRAWCRRRRNGRLFHHLKCGGPLCAFHSFDFLSTEQNSERTIRKGKYQLESYERYVFMRTAVFMSYLCCTLFSRRAGMRRRRRTFGVIRNVLVSFSFVHEIVNIILIIWFVFLSASSFQCLFQVYEIVSVQT